MNCPKCQGKTLSKIVESNFELDYCQDCGGIWFDKNELQKVIDQNINLSFDKVATNKTSVTMDIKTSMCPVCNVVLLKMPEKRIGGILLDQCPQCKGLWLDGGEFKRIKSKNLMEEIKKSLM